MTDAAKRAFLVKPLACILGALGCRLLSLLGSWCAATANPGVLLCAAGIALFSALQRGFTQALIDYCEEGLKT
ncbi:hypothetical protein DFH07DRAFT_502505 [Mycena maculata]|uniref:Uncharacterized protein n=1 Tax=Mycena maculata TaxID=230809 RepID=A0AAD7J1B6_9AGAR|nr:hypothetical protein DFH07DRAFT_502505 [Mycena maculata]